MKKYFMTGTDDELKFGDMVELDFTRENEKGNTVHHHMEVKFIPELVDMLLENGVIEVEDDGNEEESWDACPELEELSEAFDEMLEDFENLEKRVDAIEESVKRINLTLHSLTTAKREVKKNAKETGK